jgi:muconate cycloisomerase
MKISGLELYQISIPFAEPYRLSKIYGTLHDAKAVIVKINTDEGLVGLGEADPMIPFTEESPDSVMAVIRDIIAPNLLGQDPRQLTGQESSVDHMVQGHSTARGAINMALYDILGKATDTPVYQLMGGLRHERLPLLLGISSLDLEQSIAAIEALRNKGVTTVMLKMGEMPIADEIKRFIGIRKHFGKNIKLVVDANQGWDLFETLAFIDGIKGYHLDLLEQPIERRNLNDLKRIFENLACSLSADESLVEAKDAAVLIREHIVDVFSIKVSKNGGLDKSKLIAQMAADSGLKCLMNSMLEFGITQAASLHLGCTLPNLMDCGHAYGSVTRMSDDITDFDQNISGGFVTVPSGPGLGVNLKKDKLKKYTVAHVKV